MVFGFRKNQQVTSLPEFDDHHAIVFLNDEATGLKGYIAIHRKNAKQPSFGATRVWHYAIETDCLKDALRLSAMMSYKSAMAGLPYGGAKAVICLPKHLRTTREKLLTAYAKRVDLLNGSFVTGTDVGLFQQDLPILKKVTPYIVGFNNYTTQLTVEGIFAGIEVALEEVFGTSDMQERTFAIQGVGKVGETLLAMLAPKAKKIFIADIDKRKVTQLARHYKNVEVVDPDEIHKQKVDVFSPCALSGALSAKTISKLQCKIIAGGANNQLENESIGELLHRLNILYCPDYLINAGGLIAVADEYKNPTFHFKAAKKKVEKIKERLKDVIRISKREKHATNIIADQMAEKIFNQYQ